MNRKNHYERNEISLQIKTSNSNDILWRFGDFPRCVACVCFNQKKKCIALPLTPAVTDDVHFFYTSFRVDTSTKKYDG